MVITCPNCSARFRIDASGIKLPRFKVRCPKCTNGIVVENPPEVEVPMALEEEAPPASAPAAEGFPSERETDELDGGADEATATVSSSSSWGGDEPRTEDIPTSLASDAGDGADPGLDAEEAGTEPMRIAPRRPPIVVRGEPSADEAPREREGRDGIAAVRAELTERFDDLMKLNYFEILGIGKDSPPDEVKSAYFKLAKRYHPDRYVTHFSDEEMRRLREVSSRLNLAFNELRDADRHKQYVLKITQPERYEKQQSANRVMEAMMQYEKGKVLFNKQNFGESLKCFEWAVELHPTEAEYHYMVGMACRRASEGIKPDYERILAALEKAVEIQPETVKYHLGLGYYWKQRGEDKRAMRYFKTAKERDPKNHEANREIDLYLKRKRKAEEEASAGGKLKKLFGGAKK